MHKLADFENLQKTTDREVAKAKEFALSKFAEDLVKSVDVLELAIGSVSASANAKKEANPTEDAERIRADFDSLLQGVQMTASNLEKTLARYGVTKFDPVGEKFDPNKHEALFMVPLAAAGPDAKESGVVMNTQKTVSTTSEASSFRFETVRSYSVFRFAGLDVQQPRPQSRPGRRDSII